MFELLSQLRLFLIFFHIGKFFHQKVKRQEMFKNGNEL